MLLLSRRADGGLTFIFNLLRRRDDMISVSFLGLFNCRGGASLPVGTEYSNPGPLGGKSNLARGRCPTAYVACTGFGGVQFLTTALSASNPVSDVSFFVLFFSRHIGTSNSEWSRSHFVTLRCRSPCVCMCMWGGGGAGGRNISGRARFDLINLASVEPIVFFCPLFFGVAHFGRTNSNGTRNILR